MGVGVKWNVPKCIAIVIQCIPFCLEDWNVSSKNEQENKNLKHCQEPLKINTEGLGLGVGDWLGLGFN